MIALDLFPAILSAGLSTYAQTVLAEALLRFYGPQKVESVVFHTADVSEITGLDRRNARRAIVELVEANVLIEVAEFTYQFNKDFETWTPKQGKLAERLEGGLLRWINNCNSRHNKNALRREFGIVKTVSIQTQNSGPKCVYPDTPNDSEVCLHRHKTSAPIVSIQTHQNESPPDPLYKNRVRQKIKEKEIHTEREKNLSLSLLPHQNGVAECVAEPFHAEPSPVDLEGMIPDHQVPNDASEIRRVAAKAEAMFPMLEFGRQVEDAAKVYPVELVEEALLRVKGTGKRVRWPYVWSVIRGLDEEGWKPLPRPMATPDGIAACPPPERPPKAETRQQAFLRRNREELERMEREDREAEEAARAAR